MAERKVNCPHCRQPLRVVQSASRFVICPKCRRAAELGAGRAQALPEKPWAEPSGASLAVGETTTVRGRPYLVTGLTQYRDTEGNLSTDYELDARGSREASLEEADGEWTLNNAFPENQRSITLSGDKAKLNRQTFPSLGRYRLEIVTAAGEFAELPKPGERAEYAYFEGEDYDLGAELGESGEPVRWYLCYSLEGNEAPASARVSSPAVSWFGKFQEFLAITARGPLALKQTRAALDGARVSARPTSGQRKAAAEGGTSTGEIVKWSFIFVAAAIAIHVMFTANSQDKLVLDSGPLTVGTSAPWVSEPFTLEGRTSNVMASVQTNLNNQWLALELTLVNTQTGRWYRRIEEVSYHHGVDGGESWSEGDRNPDAYFSSIPSGQYQLEVAAFADHPQTGFQLKLRRDSTNGWYLLVSILIFLALPLLFAIKAMNK